MTGRAKKSSSSALAADGPLEDAVEGAGVDAVALAEVVGADEDGGLGSCCGWYRLTVLGRAGALLEFALLRGGDGASGGTRSSGTGAIGGQRLRRTHEGGFRPLGAGFGPESQGR